MCVCVCVCVCVCARVCVRACMHVCMMRESDMIPAPLCIPVMRSFSQYLKL